MFLVRRKTVITAGVMVCLGAGFTLALRARLPGPDGVRDFAARERGAAYLGTEGVVMQSSRNDCGHAALMMVLEWFGKCVPPRGSDRNCGTTDAPRSMLELKSIAERCGLQATGWKLKPGELSKSSGPKILFIEKRHFVVFDSVDAAGIVYIRDPAIGRMKMDIHALTRAWNGEALEFGKRPDNTRQIE